MSETSPLSIVVFEVADLDRSLALYRDGFGVELTPGESGGDDYWISGRFAEASWVAAPGLHFVLFQSKDGSVTRGAQVGFFVTDIDAAHKAAVAQGAIVEHDPREEAWGVTGRYWDFDGNVVSLTQRD